MVIIFLSTQSKKREVIAFLDELKSILENADFDIDTDLTLISKKKQGQDQNIQHHILYWILITIRKM